MKWYQLEASTKVILKVFLVAVIVALAWYIRDILIIVVLAVILASAMEPLVGYLHQRRVPRAVSVLAVYVLVLGLFGLVLSLVVPVVVQELRLIGENLPNYFNDIVLRFPSLKLILGDADATDVVRQVATTFSGEGGVLTRTVGVFNGFFSLITLMVVSFYLVAEQHAMINFIKSLVPQGQQAFALSLVRKVQSRMGLWVLGQVILSCIIFLMTYLGLSLLGVKYALFLAMLAGLLEVIPYIGPFVAAVPAVFIALTQGPPLALAVVILYLVVQKTEGYVLVPKIMEKTVGTSPLLVLLSLLVGFRLAGIPGLLLSVPLAGAVTLIINELTAKQVDEPAQT
jgi:predicted PurR-regulated permease PerM